MALDGTSRTLADTVAGQLLRRRGSGECPLVTEGGLVCLSTSSWGRWHGVCLPRLRITTDQMPSLVTNWLCCCATLTRAHCLPC